MDDLRSKYTFVSLTGYQTDEPINASFHVRLDYSYNEIHARIENLEQSESESESVPMLMSGCSTRKRKPIAMLMKAAPSKKMTTMSIKSEPKDESSIEVINIAVSKTFTNLKEIELCTDDFQNVSEPKAGFISTMKLGNSLIGIDHHIKPNVTKRIILNALAPENDPDKEERKQDIQQIRGSYEVEYVEGFPIKLTQLPYNETFAIGYEIGLGLKAVEAKAQNYLSSWFGAWETLKDINDVYYTFVLTQPKASYYWREDTWFGNQRLNRCNPKSIKLCKKIPSKLGVDEKMMKPVLKGETLKGLMKKKRLFYTDLEILEGIWHKEDYDFCAPIALFMLDYNNDLVPIAIQLQQQKGPDNPVFLPTDDWGVWTLAKMWYNLADSSYHQSVVHLGLTHLLMQIVVVYMQRNISSRHPVYKILAPHKYFLMAINDLAFDTLIVPGGYVDKAMTIGSKGMLNLFAKELERWDFFQDGIPANDFANRNVDDPNVLPKYYYRDDSIDLYNCIHKYVSEYIDLHYENDKDIEDDWEIQDWIEYLVRDGKIKGLPMKNGKGHLSTKEELKSIVAVIIFTCSVSHAAVNFLQYEEYGFPANYPTMLRTPLLKDKKPKTDSDILEAMPDKETVCNVLAVTYLLSSRGTNSLGHFETQYICEDKGIDCVKRFQIALLGIGQKIRERNETVERPYDILLPDNIPNAISI